MKFPKKASYKYARESILSKLEENMRKNINLISSSFGKNREFLILFIYYYLYKILPRRGGLINRLS